MATFLNRGALADAFDLHDGTVVKVYRRVSQTHAEVKDWNDHEMIIRRLFLTEVRAYETLQRQADLSMFLPRYWGTFDLSDLDIPAPTAEPFMANCALRLEHIPGHDIKVNSVDSALVGEIHAVLSEMQKRAGPFDTSDASCFIPGPRSSFVLIDFALWKDWPNAQAHLDAHGCLPPALR